MSASENNVELIRKTRQYAEENFAISIWVVASTFTLLLSAAFLSFMVSSPYLKLCIAIVIGLLVMRCFILFHDYHHKAILQKSWWAKLLFDVFGMLVFVPSGIWKQSHNFHHAHNAVIETSHIGSFWTVSVEKWMSMDRLARLKYRFVRHPVTLILGLLTVFIYDHCINSFVRHPVKNVMGLLVLLLHICMLLCAFYFGFLFDYMFAWLLPIAIAGCLGSYLFYAQHNFPGVVLLSRQEWTYSEAALKSTCFIEMSTLMHWFTGNIAYHHVHHLNHRIPFYRLPEAMKNIEELHSPTMTSLRLNDVIACLQIKLWDQNENRMISLADFNKRATRCVST